MSGSTKHDDTPLSLVPGVPVGAEFSEMGPLLSALQAATEAMRDYCTVLSPSVKESGSCRVVREQQSEDYSLGETRCYYVSPRLREKEEAILEACQVSSMVEVLQKAYNSFSVLITFMNHLDADYELPPYFIQSLGELMQESLNLLGHANEFFSDLDSSSVIQ